MIKKIISLFVTVSFFVIMQKGIIITGFNKNTQNTNIVSFELKENENWEIGQELEIPDLPTNIKTYTDYKWYGIEGSPHNRLQKSCWTDIYGCRRFDSDFCVAMGSYYSNLIGDRFEITLDTDIYFTVIIADQKSDKHTDDSHMYSPCINYEKKECANVLEFIVDTKKMSKKVCNYGSLDGYKCFEGNIKKIVYLGRDTSQDWDLYE